MALEDSDVIGVRRVFVFRLQFSTFSIFFCLFLGQLLTKFGHFFLKKSRKNALHPYLLQEEKCENNKKPENEQNF